jgi:UDP-N-acetylglucosamine--N-acetylmuramyl-(pentapeptide) pyrophosphoryl-undecaprenol N-acetylglucosamine transferase
MAETRARAVRLCLAGSGGGHVRQLLDLEPLWRERNYFFVTEDTALGQSLAQTHPVSFVRHYALGQARLGHPLKMVGSALINLWQSIRMMVVERPDIVISTGAGAVFWVVFIARLLGAKFILIESFARFDRPSAFARIAKPFAHHVIVQSPQLAAIWPDALVFDPLRRLDGVPPDKEPLVFATVGATLGFNRLIDGVLDEKRAGRLPEMLILQKGTGDTKDPGLDDVRLVQSLPFDEIQTILKRASIVITHGGTGSLVTALREGCRVIAVPRSFENGEHYDNHQFEITSAFAARGLIDVATTPEELSAALVRAREAIPVMATTDPSALIGWLEAYISQLDDD